MEFAREPEASARGDSTPDFCPGDGLDSSAIELRYAIARPNGVPLLLLRSPLARRGAATRTVRARDRPALRLWVALALRITARAVGDDARDIRRVVAASLSLALTGVCMIACRAVHPPASATTLIVSLGIVTMPRKLVIIEVAVALLTLQAIVINRHAGIDYPLWTLHEYRRQEPG